MAECVFCKSETELQESGTPVCDKCAEAHLVRQIPLGDDLTPPSREVNVREILRQEVLETTATVNAASDEFNSLLSAIPSGVPHPDGTQRIHQASRKLSVARKEMIRAHSRLNDFLSRGIVPEATGTALPPSGSRVRLPSVTRIRIGRSPGRANAVKYGQMERSVVPA